MSPTEPETPGPEVNPTTAAGDQSAAPVPDPPIDPPTQVTPPADPAPAGPAPDVPPPPPPPLPEPPVSEPPPTSSGLPNPHGLPEIAVERPEVAVGAAFAGGLVVAMILKRLGRSR